MSKARRVIGQQTEGALFRTNNNNLPTIEKIGQLTRVWKFPLQQIPNLTNQLTTLLSKMALPFVPMAEK